MTSSHGHNSDNDSDSVHSQEGALRGEENPKAPRHQEEKNVDPLAVLLSESEAMYGKIQEVFSSPIDSDFLLQPGGKIDGDIVDLLKRWDDLPSGIELDDERKKSRDWFRQIALYAQQRGADWKKDYDRKSHPNSFSNHFDSTREGFYEYLGSHETGVYTQHQELLVSQALDPWESARSTFRLAEAPSPLDVASALADMSIAQSKLHPTVQTDGSGN